MEEKPSANCFLCAAKPINRGTLGVVLLVGGEKTTFISEVLFSEMFSTDARFFYILPNPK